MPSSVQQAEVSVSSNAADALRQRLFEGMVPVPTFAAAVNCTTRTVSTWINEGLPVHYVGRDPYVIIEPARAWLLARRKRRREPRGRGRPRKSMTA